MPRAVVVVAAVVLVGSSLIWLSSLVTRGVPETCASSSFGQRLIAPDADKLRPIVSRPASDVVLARADSKLIAGSDGGGIGFEVLASWKGEFRAGDTFELGVSPVTPGGVRFANKDSYLLSLSIDVRGTSPTGRPRGGYGWQFRACESSSLKARAFAREHVSKRVRPRLHRDSAPSRDSCDATRRRRITPDFRIRASARDIVAANINILVDEFIRPVHPANARGRCTGIERAVRTRGPTFDGHRGRALQTLARPEPPARRGREKSV